MKKFELWGTATVFAVVIVGFIISFISPDFFRYKYTIEDGILENLTAIFLLTGAIICFRRIYILKAQRSIVFLFCTFLLGALFLFGAGEEISWGQRIFDIQSNDFFKKHNTQGEITLHNLSFTNDEGKKVKINKLVFSKILTISIIIYMLILPVLYRKKESMKKLINKLAIPLAKNHQILLYIALAIIVSLCPSKKKGELLEFGGCFMFLMITIYPLNIEAFTKKKS